MRRVIALVVITALAFALPVYGQQASTPPDYRVFNAASGVSADGDDMIITFSVINIGGPADQEATIQLINLADGQLVATSSLRPLDADETLERIELRFPVRSFPPGSDLLLQISVGVGEIEAQDNPTVSNNYAGVRASVPDYDQTAQPPTPVLTPETVGSSSILEIPVIGLEIDTADRTELGIALGIVLAIVVMILILLLIVRLLFRQTPTFGNWQPPYATMPPLDPNSTLGRRQLWQQHAQSNTLPAPCAEGAIYVRKVLYGMDGYYLSGWAIKAARMTQYDMYGRVSRSQVLATPGQIRRLNSIARKSASLDPARMTRRVRSVAKGLARQFRKKVNRRSAMLPIALDIRFQGTHGEVQIMFELYQCQRGQLQQLDQWEPEMTVLGKGIHEVYTATIFGQTGGETFHEFRKRLPDDIARVLVEMLSSPPTNVPARPGPEAASLSTQPVQQVNPQQ